MENRTIIPITKPGKDSLNPVNYCPIALTSCLCRTMERMVKKSLVYGIQQPYHQFPKQFQKAKIYHGPCGQIGNLHMSGKHPKTTSYCSLLQSRESL